VEVYAVNIACYLESVRLKRKTGYHHGDLRRALLAASLPLLRKGGPEALTLRAVARAAGVSQTAPYRHFADRSALVAAVAEDGFRRLYARLIVAARSPDETIGKAQETERGGLQAIALAYVRFALEHPDEYRVMFGSAIAATPATEGSARQAVFAFLEGGIAALQQQNLVRKGDSYSMALSAWSLVHGLAMLAIDGQLSGKVGGAPSAEELTLTATELLMFGMAPQ
jgi:AcrR family transcriptional regulator